METCKQEIAPPPPPPPPPLQISGHAPAVSMKNNNNVIIESNLRYTRGNTPKCETSGGTRLRGLALGQHSSEETSQRRRAVGDIVSDLTGPGIESQTSRTNSVCLTTELTD